ncbi:hypothetical protein ACFYXQ_41380 [Nocardia jiangxiensis]|uniref:Rho termination factor N-terminal domain-containing protein n=1 Tax=Nocardia jiangxiensis TaxID=282685 RepID=A0ABW6SG48_9NOCA
MNDLRSFAALQSRVYEFLERQDEATLRAIISGTARLDVVVDGASSQAGSASHENVRIAPYLQPVDVGIVPSRDPVQVAYQLSQLSSERRRSYLSAANLTVAELQDVAKRLGLRGYSKLTKAKLFEALISHGIVSADVVASQSRPLESSSSDPADGLPATGSTVLEGETASDESRSAGTAPPIEPNSKAAHVASHLRETETEEEGAAYLRAQQLDRATMLAVATELHLTRVDRLSRTELERRVLEQAIGARRKFGGLRKW